MGLFETLVENAYVQPVVNDIIESGQAAGKLECDQISLETAQAFAEAIFKANKRELYDSIPEFDQNFLLAQRLTKIGKTRRRDMPVINDNQVREFQTRLKDGKLDINKPLAPDANPSNPWPEGLSGKEAQRFIDRGLRDNDLQDDKIKVSQVKVPVKKLKPIQRQIYFDKSVTPLAEFGVPSSRSFFQSTMTIMSEDEYIIDGHHRWLASLIIDPTLPMSGIKIALPISKLLPVALSYGDAIGNKRNQ